MTFNPFFRCANCNAVLDKDPEAESTAWGVAFVIALVVGALLLAVLFAIVGESM